MIYRPRAGNASRRDSSLAHRHPSIASRRTRGAIALFWPRSAFAGRSEQAWGTAVRSGEVGRTAGDRRRSLNAAPRSGRCPSSERSRARYAAARGIGAIGNPPHPVAGPWSVGWMGGEPGPYTPVRSPCRVEAAGAGEPLGGPAIARSGRVVRPVRRPTDRQTNRRPRGGDQREICNQIPRPSARDLSIYRAEGAQHEMAGA